MLTLSSTTLVWPSSSSPEGVPALNPTGRQLLHLQERLKLDTSSLLVGHYPLKPEIARALWRLPVPRHPPLKLFGKIARPQRNTAFFSDEAKEYQYSRLRMVAQALTPELRRILADVNWLFKEQFNGVLVNVYEGGGDYISAHSDDETSLGGTGVVALSLGATRKFRVRFKNEKGIVLDLDMPEGCLLWMRGADFQKECTHEVPPTKLDPDGQRLSLTFRHHRSCS